MGCVFYLRLVRVEGGKVSSCGLCVLSKSCQVEREKVSGLCILSKGCPGRERKGEWLSGVRG